jgi:transposase
MLLPPDLRDWLPEDHLVWLVLEVVDQLDLTAIVSTYRRGGVGREAYDPAMLTALLVYCYCCGVRSSRQIERSCVTDVAVRVIAAQQRPDYSTLCRFRSAHAQALADLFGQVLAICARAGLGRVGVIAVDGSKIAGQASPRKNYTADTLRRLAATIVEEAAAVDAAEDQLYGADRRGDEMPAGLAPGSGRAARIRQALANAEQEHAEAQAADVAAAEAKLERAPRVHARERDWVEHRPRRTRQRRSSRVPVEKQVKVKRAADRVTKLEEEVAKAKTGQGPRATRREPTSNPSDPDSHLMFVRGKGYLQGYNAQLAVSDDHLILASDVTNDTNDIDSFIPMMQQAVANVAAHLPNASVGLILADAGYCSHETLTAPGPDRLIATGRQPGTPARTGKDPAIAAMAARLTEGSPDRETYRRRQATVEPVIGHLKDRIGLRRFSRRGLQAARHELAIAAIAHNIRRLATI